MPSRFTVIKKLIQRAMEQLPIFLTDYDDDHFISGKDIEQTCTALTNGQLTSEEIAVVREKILEETDHDGDDRISFAEFQHVIARAPDFLR